MDRLDKVEQHKEDILLELVGIVNSLQRKENLDKISLKFFWNFLVKMKGVLRHVAKCKQSFTIFYARAQAARASTSLYFLILVLVLVSQFSPSCIILSVLV